MKASHSGSLHFTYSYDMPTLSLQQLRSIFIPRNVRMSSDNRYMASKTLIPHADAISLVSVLEDYFHYYPVSFSLGANQLPNEVQLIAANTVTLSAANATQAGVMSSTQASELASLITLTGVPSLSVDLGTFTGSIIPPNSTIKAALQALETAYSTGGNGIYGGSGVIPSSTKAEVTDSFKVSYSPLRDAIHVDKPTLGVSLKSDSATPAFVTIQDTNVYISDSTLEHSAVFSPLGIDFSKKVYSGSLWYKMLNVSLSAVNHDFTLPALEAYSFIRMSSSTSAVLTGINAYQSEGRMITVYNNGNYDITIVHNSSSSTSGNRFFLPSDITLTPGMALQFLYTANAWRLMNMFSGLFTSSGTVSQNCVATVPSNSFLYFTYDNASTAVGIYEGATPSAYISSKNGLYYTWVNDTAVEVVGNAAKLNIGSTGSVFEDFTTSPKGLRYANNYHATYDNRSLVDKEYVDLKALPSPLSTNAILMSNGSSFVQVVEQMYYLTGHTSSVVNLPSIPFTNANMKVYVNGILKTPTDDYTVSSSTVTFNIPIISSDKLAFNYYTLA